METFVKVQLADRKVASALKPVPVSYQKMVLVCTHASRDKRCGRAGPQVGSVPLLCRLSVCERFSSVLAVGFEHTPDTKVRGGFGSIAGLRSRLHFFYLTAWALSQQQSYQNINQLYFVAIIAEKYHGVFQTRTILFQLS